MSEETPNSVDPRVNLARERTGMAIHRTGLAPERTTFTWIQAIRVGTALILPEVVATLLAGLSRWSAPRGLRRGPIPASSPWPLGHTAAMLSAVIGLAGLRELFARSRCDLSRRTARAGPHARVFGIEERRIVASFDIS